MGGRERLFALFELGFQLRVRPNSGPSAAVMDAMDYDLHLFTDAAPV